MPFAAINSKKVHYACPIDLTKPQGRIILLVHGAAANHKVWTHQVAHLAQQHRPIAVDQPGSGFSDGPAPKRLSDYLDVLHELAHKLGLGTFVFCGHSMGGALGIDYALAYPREVAAYVMVCSSARISIPPDRLKLQGQDPAGYRRMRRASNLSRATSWPIAGQVEDILAEQSAEVAMTQLGAVSGFEAWERIRGIACPTLLAFGDSDPNVDQVGDLLRRIPNSTFRIIHNAGHYPMWEQPQQLNQAIDEFLATLP